MPEIVRAEEAQVAAQVEETLPIVQAEGTWATVRAEEMLLTVRTEETSATGRQQVEATALDPGIFLAGPIKGAMRSAVEADLTERELGRTPAAAHRAWVPAEALEAEATEGEDSVAAEVVVVVAAVAGADSSDHD